TRMLAPSSRTTSNVSLGTGTTKFILLLSASRIVGQCVAHGWQVLDRSLPARVITYTIAAGSRSAPKTRDRALAPSGLQIFIRQVFIRQVSIRQVSIRGE